MKFQQKQFSEESRAIFVEFICRIEGWKTRCKNLHWAAPRKNIHEYLDDFLGILSDYQDSIAEGFMGISSQLKPLEINGINCACPSANEFIDEVSKYTEAFYKMIPVGTEWKGITSETETFIQNIKKYDYLFSLCNN